MNIDIEKIKGLIVAPANKADIQKAIELQNDAQVHFTGNNYLNLLNQLIGHESAEDFKLKRELGEPITKPLCDTILKELTRFASSGYVIRNLDCGKSENEKNKLHNTLNKVYADKSLSKFTHQWLIPALFYRFNDFIVITRPSFNGNKAIVSGIERSKELAPDAYIVTVSINDVIDYKKTGDKVEYLIYKYGKITRNNLDIQLIRYIDDVKDVIFSQQNNEIAIDVNYEILQHTEIPCTQVGRQYADISNSNVCKSLVDSSIPLMRRLIKFDAINIMSEVFTAYPLRWMIGQSCDNDKCDNGYIINANEKILCPTCGGTKFKSAIKPGNLLIIPNSLNVNEKPLATAPAGVIEGDSATTKQQAERLEQRKREIYEYCLGMQPLTQAGISRTATEVEINTKPLEDRNNAISSIVEDIEEWIIKIIANQSKIQSLKHVSITYSKRLNLKSENDINNELSQAKLNGASQNYIYSLVEEQIMIKYSNDKAERERQLILAKLEPFVGFTVTEVINNNYIKDIDKLVKVNFNNIINDFESKYKIKELENIKEVFKQYILTLNLKEDEKQTNELLETNSSKEKGI